MLSPVVEGNDEAQSYVAYQIRSIILYRSECLYNIAPIEKFFSCCALQSLLYPY